MSETGASEQASFHSLPPGPLTRRGFLETGASSLGGLMLANTLAAREQKKAPGRTTGLQVGFGAADITPSVGMEMPGGFFKATSKGVRDRLWAVACVVEDGITPLALVG